MAYSLSATFPRRRRAASAVVCVYAFTCAAGLVTNLCLLNLYVEHSRVQSKAIKKKKLNSVLKQLQTPQSQTDGVSPEPVSFYELISVVTGAAVTSTAQTAPRSRHHGPQVPWKNNTIMQL